MSAAPKLDPAAHRDEEIGVADMAKAWGISRSAARRRLLDIEEKAPGVVYRRPGRGGGRGEMLTTAPAIAPFVRRTPETRLVTRVRRLEEDLAAEQRRGDVLARELQAHKEWTAAEFRRVAAQWFSRKSTSLK